MKNNEFSSEIVDLSFLNENFGQDRNSYAQMIQFFFDQSDEKVQLLIESVKTKDFAIIKSTAHFLKSSFNIMGLKCNNSLIEIEKLSVSQTDIEKINQLTDLVVSNFNESVAEYQRILTILNETDK